MSNIIKTVKTLIEEAKVSFISSVDSNGFPNTKAMLAPRKIVGLKHFYFTTNTSSMRVRHYKENPNASLYFCNDKTFQGVMLLGTMEVLTDAATKEDIWREGDELYYPLGVTDPDYSVLKLSTISGRIYGNFNSQDFITE